MAIVFSGREEMLSGANAFLSLALLWRMPGGAQHGQENDFIRLMLICRRISKASNRRAWLSALQPRRDNHLTSFQIPTNHCIPDSPETVTSSRSLTTSKIRRRRPLIDRAFRCLLKSSRPLSSIGKICATAHASQGFQINTGSSVPRKHQSLDLVPPS